MASKNLLVRGGADFSGLKKEMDKTQKNLANFQKNVGKAMSTIGKILGTIAIGSLVKSSTEAAMAVESAVDNINRNMGNSAGAFQKWVETQSSAFAMGKKDAYSYGATFSNLLSSFSSGTSETAANTQELLKVISVVASKTGRSFEDTADRIRSGLLGSTEAIEDLGIYTNISMIESTEAFKKFAGDSSWSQLDFQTQQQIRLAAILEQAYARYGDTLADTTATRQAQFVASLNNVKLSLGQAFLPIYNYILPALTAMANALGKVIGYIAQFTTALFGKSGITSTAAKTVSTTTGAVSGLGDSIDNAGSSASKAAKKAKGALSSIDEINKLSQTDTSGGGASGGAGVTGGVGDIGTIDPGGSFADSTVAVSKKVQDMAKKIKTTISDLTKFLKKNKTEIISVVGGILAAFASFRIISNWGKIVSAFSTALTAIGTAMSSISVPILVVSALIGLIVGNIIYLWQTNESFRDSVIEVWDNICTFLSTVVQDTWSIIKGIWDTYGQTLIDNVKGFMKSIQDIIVGVWESVLKPFINNALDMLTWLWDKHLKGLVEELGVFIMKLVNGALEIWNEFISPLINWLIEELGPVFSRSFSFVVDVVGSAVALISDIAKGLLKALGGVIDFIVGIFTGDWEKAWEGVKDIFGGIFDALVGLAKAPINLIIDAMNMLIRGVNKFKIDIPNWVAKLVGFKGGSIGFNIPTIPKLAQGGYVGANSPILAMIGDNRREGEIVAPESKIYEQTLKAVLDGMKATGGKNLELTINLGSRRLIHQIIKDIDDLQNQTGKPVFNF